jgi:hypothetical protein
MVKVGVGPNILFNGLVHLSSSNSIHVKISITKSEIYKELNYKNTLFKPIYKGLSTPYTSMIYEWLILFD